MRLRTVVPRTVRGRATVAASLVVCVALAVGAFTLLLILEHNLRSALDRNLTVRTRDLAAVAPGLPEGMAPAAGGEEDVALVVGPDGHIIGASADAYTDAAPPFALFAGADEPRLRTLTGHNRDGETEAYRVAAMTAGDGRTVYVADSMEHVSEPVATVRVVLLVGLPPLLALLTCTTWLVVGRSLRPVEAIRAEVADISEHALHRRVPVPATHDEIGRLARTMNEMLARLESAGDRQRTFVADASHELQTPLALFRTRLEVALAHPEANDWPSTARGLLDADRAMERLVRDLLFLARDDESGGDATAHRHSAPLDLDVVVLEEAAGLRPASRVRIDTSQVSAGPVRGSRDDVARLVRNLLDNAARHAASAVRVSVALTPDARSVVLEVEDDGPGVPEEFRPHLFERFTRADTSRARTGGGTGLGLAIVKTIAERHDGTVAVGDRPDGASGARFTVRLPAD
ncbi:HAMP domain-containing histidine kinase [Yinghuangia sp. ASG 101]|uniref:sensor histidine kinase n=1 Tax=Yinghuangia sp. ASG 101 TaxID=2896848 RepID=UPI001E3A0907|nr:ATP-binding protein [Yinghuangia sp. ASG 101]UGQ11575.1 HAMP domain-containing histidine kinase [Yinghuangia sp. ASG 101]